MQVRNEVKLEYCAKYDSLHYNSLHFWRYLWSTSSFHVMAVLHDSRLILKILEGIICMQLLITIMIFFSFLVVGHFRFETYLLNMQNC